MQYVTDVKSGPKGPLFLREAMSHAHPGCQAAEKSLLFEMADILDAYGERRDMSRNAERFANAGMA